MKTRCDVCGDCNITADHEVSPNHIKNKTLSEYSKYKKQYSGNRKGVVVLCNVGNIKDCAEAVLKISAKPNEEIKFNFTIKNDTNKEEIAILFIKMVQPKKYFEMNKHGIVFGCTPVVIKPKTTLDKEVTVTFKMADIGQYEMPMMFSFRKPSTKEGILIMRDIVVFVEESPTVHEKIKGPYLDKEVKASVLYRASSSDRRDNKYPIPKPYKQFYSNNITLSKTATSEEKKLYDSIKEIFSTGVTKDNYIRFFHHLLWLEEAVVRIHIKKYNMSGVSLVKNGDFCYSLEVPGLAEKRPSLLIGDLLFIKPQNEDCMFEAHIHEVQENTTIINKLNYKFHSNFSPNTLFDVRFFISRLSLERMHHAVNCITNDGPDICRVFPEPNKKVVKVDPIDTFYNPLVENNVEQRCAVEHIVAGTSGRAPYLVHGPPGTGKTVTIVEAILQLVTKNPMNRIMVCTDSNMAADHVASMLIKYTELVPKNVEKLLLRANSEFRAWETLPECLFKYSNGHNRRTFYPIDIKSFKSYNIVITTLSHAAKFARDLTRKNTIRFVTHLFVDEAAQASEPASLIPVSGMLAPSGTLVLAGDPRQLPPVVISSAAKNNGLGLSLMERLKTTCPLYSDEREDSNYMVMLKNNFRSDPTILELPNRLFYNGMLRAYAPHDTISEVNILGDRPTCRAMVFHAVLSQEQRIGKSPSYFNNMELELVQKYIMKLIIVHKVQPEEIGVIAPYIRQVYKLKSWLKEQKLFEGQVEVGTVEAFQGKEKRVVIVSTVRARAKLLDFDARFRLGFLVDDKRFNVALTRAKSKVIIIGNPTVLERDAKWRGYIEKCRELGTYYGYDDRLHSTEESQTDVVSRLAPLLSDLKLNAAAQENKYLPYKRN